MSNRREEISLQPASFDKGVAPALTVVIDIEFAIRRIVRGDLVGADIDTAVPVGRRRLWRNNDSAWLRVEYWLKSLTVIERLVQSVRSYDVGL